MPEPTAEPSAAISRRRFLLFVALFGPATEFGRIARAQFAALMEHAHGHWIPSEEQVAEWLMHYKLATIAGAHSLGYALAAMVDTETLEQTREWISKQEGLDLAMADFDRARVGVAFAMGAGYSAGRDGAQRMTPEYTRPSHQGFAWYNGWAVGDADRRRREAPCC